MRKNTTISTTSTNQKLKAFVLIIDAVHEISIGIGRTAQVEPIFDEEAYVTASTLRGLNISEGENADLNIDILNMIFTLGLIPQTTS